jgi:enoyl-CoA hydratase/carnithine racemase
MPTTLRPLSTTRIELWLSQPETANALSEELTASLAMHLEEALAKMPRLLVIRAEGKNFCGGFDLSAYETLSQQALAERFAQIEAVLQRLRHAPAVTVALVQGAAFGAGADLVAACRFRVGRRDCRFKFPGSRFGIVLGTSHLAHIIGVQNAQEIILRNQLVTAEHAADIGLLHALIEEEPDFDAWLDRLEQDLEDLDTPTLQRLLALLTPDTRARDTAELIASATRPGLHERLAHYLSTNKKKKPLSP